MQLFPKTLLVLTLLTLACTQGNDIENGPQNPQLVGAPTEVKLNTFTASSEENDDAT